MVFQKSTFLISAFQPSLSAVVFARRLCACLSAVALLGLLAGCKGAGQTQTNAPAAAATATAATWFPIRVGDKTLQMQLALTPQEQARGLMERQELAQDHGMLFVFDAGRKQAFWMLNTPLALDIGYFDNDGVLREVYPLYPFDRTTVPSRRSDIRYVLEMEQNWFAKNGVHPGAQLDTAAVAGAVKQRGF